MGVNKTGSAIGWCDACGKLSYSDRKAAKEVANKHPRRKQVYECPGENFFPVFHVGSLPRLIRQGHVTRSEMFKKGNDGHEVS